MRVCANARACAVTALPPPPFLAHAGRWSDRSVVLITVLCLQKRVGMTSQSSVNAERLWSSGDGATCLLVEREEAPRYEICLMRGGDILGEHRLYARAAAEMVAETWRSAGLRTKLQPSRVYTRFSDCDF